MNTLVEFLLPKIMNSFQTEISISFLIIGCRGVGKSKIIEKICGKDRKDNPVNFYNFNIYFTEKDSDETAKTTYDFNTSLFQKNSVVVITYSRTDMESYQFAIDLYKIIRSGFNSVFFIETHQDKNDELERDDQFETDVRGKVIPCDPPKMSKEELFGVFLYICTMFHKSIYLPNINACFPTHEVRNLVATSQEMNRTFILTCKSLKMYSFNSNSPSERFINFQFTPEFSFYHPISLVTNWNGTKLILITKFSFYLIDNFHSGFDPTNFLHEIHSIAPKELDLKCGSGSQIIDVQFLPLLPDFFAVIFENSIKIYRIVENDSCIQKFWERNSSATSFLQVSIKMCKFRQPFDGMRISDLLTLYYLTNEGKIYCDSVSFDSTNIDMNQIIDFRSIREKGINPIEVEIDERRNPIFKIYIDSSRSYYYFEYQKYKNEPKLLEMLFRVPPKKENEKSRQDNPIIVHGFDFIKNEIVIYGGVLSSNSNESNQISRQGFFHAVLENNHPLLTDVEGLTKDLVDDVDGFFKIQDNLFVKTKKVLYAFDFYLKHQKTEEDEIDKYQLFVHEAIKSRGIIGFTNSPFSCIIAPGYFVDLNQGKHKFTRVNPILLYKSQKLKDLKDDYESFKKSQKAFFEEFEKKIKDLHTESEECKNSTAQVLAKYTQEKEGILDDAKDIGAKLDQLEKDAKDILNKIKEIQHIQANKTTDYYY